MLNTVVYDHQTFALQQYGGISRYICELASRINCSADFRSRIVAPLHFNDHLAQSAAPKVGLHMRMCNLRTARLYRAVNRLVGPLLIRATHPSLVHRTYYAPSARQASLPTVVTVHDMIHELFADQFSTKDPTSRDKRRCVEQAERVLCVSQNTAADLIRIFNVPRDKISVTHLGFSQTFTAATAEGEVSPHTRPYLLYVGHRGGYKNFNGALRAYAASARLRDSFDLLTFGGFPFAPGDAHLLRSVGLRDGSVRRLTGSDDELAHAYRHARALIYPSLYEGFGIPPLEAMSSRCPVACSNTSSIPEVVGNAATLFDPTDLDSMRSALERVCFDDTVHAELVAAGLQRVQKFSWDHCARDTLNAYRVTLGL